jgi:hypothetical protein
MVVASVIGGHQRAASAPHHDVVVHHHDLESAVQNAERAFVVRDYQRALKISSEILSAGSHSLETEASGGNCCVCLQIRAVGLSTAEEFSFVICMTFDIALTDRAAAVALQSSYEISDKDSTVFLTWYRRRPMPIPVAILWIQFTFSTNVHKQNAVEMAAELLRHVGQFPHVSDLSDDLCFMLFTDMLAYCENEDFVQDLLDRIHAPTWKLSRYTYVHMSKANPQVLSILLAHLNLFSLGVSVDRCREKLESLSMEAEDSSNKVQVNEHDSMTSENHNVGWKCLIGEWQSMAVVSRRILNVFRDHVVRPILQDDENRWMNRGRFAISAVLLYLAWKKRRKLSLLTTTTVTTLVASPLREILEALRPQRC